MTTPIYQFWWRSYEKQGQDFERKIEKMPFTSCRLWWPSFPCIFDVIVFALTFFKNILFFQHNVIRLSQKFHVIFRHNQLKFGQEPSQQSLFTVLQNFCIIYYICHYYICDWIKNLHKDDAFIQKKKTILLNFDTEELSTCHFPPNTQIFEILSLHCRKSRILRGQFSTLVSL